ncbi:MAG: type II methionyl aminopeptidase [Candidatus Nanoarchaeia archaeon]
MESENSAKYEKAGIIAAKVMSFIKDKIKEGAVVLELAKVAEAKIVELGGKPAFPVNISINEIAAHYTPRYNDTLVLKKGDLVKFDFGVHVDGYPADAAFSISVGKNEENERLIEAANAALKAALSSVKPNIEVSKIGAAIETTVRAAGLQVVKNLSGHGIKKFDLHAEPSIPNFDNNDKTKLENGIVIAIEPFVTNGKGFVEDTGSCEIYRIIKTAPIRDREVLDFMLQEFGPLPFAKRWVVEKFGLMRTSLALREAISKGILHEYKILKEVSGAKVAQAEHSVLVSKKTKIFTVTED